VTKRTTAARKTIREETLPRATARASLMPRTIQRRLIATAGRTSAKRGRTSRLPAELASKYELAARAIAAPTERASRSPSTVSASSRNLSGCREISRTLIDSVPESTTSANQPTSARPSVIRPYGPGFSSRIRISWMTAPMARAAPSPAASVRKLRMTREKNECPERPCEIRALTPATPAETGSPRGFVA
jgi:hypothetical protein